MAAPPPQTTPPDTHRPSTTSPRNIALLLPSDPEELLSDAQRARHQADLTAMADNRRQVEQGYFGTATTQ
jgi:hypothetical protein